ncbi:MAG: hypothetical protein II704_06580 [Erysipelotrichaceae bacterium]|nr:hypothetical protein [Erysipelotrichaceae bacterium]
MTRIKRIGLMSGLYISLFIASFCLVTYFNGYQFLGQLFLQLMAGIVALIAAVVIIFLMFKNSNYRLKDLILVEEEESDQALERPLDNSEETKLNESDEESRQQENQLDNSQNSIAQQFIDTSLLPPETDAAPQQEPEMKAEEIPEPPADQIAEPQPVITAQQMQASAVNEPQLTVKPEVSDPLTETQINYINSSANSYLNEKGLPQLVMTNDLSKEDIERRKRQYENPQEILEPEEVRESYDEEVDEDFYIQDEGQDRLAAVLVRIIIILVFILIFICGYYVYSRYLG